MILFLSLFALALGSVSTSSEPEIRLERGTCPMFWYSFNGRCYKYVATHMTWAEAELHCVSEGANLVSVHSSAEHDFLNLWSRTLTLLKDAHGSDSVISIRKVAGCGLMVLQQHFSLGVPGSQTTKVELNIVFKLTLIQIKNGMMHIVLTTTPRSVQVAQPLSSP